MKIIFEYNYNNRTNIAEVTAASDGKSEQMKTNPTPSNSEFHDLHIGIEFTGKE